MNKYIEEIDSEKAKADLTRAAVSEVTGIPEADIEKLPQDTKDNLAVITAEVKSKKTESLFDDLEADYMSLLEKVNIIIKRMKLQNASDVEIVEAIKTYTGMKLEEAESVYKGIKLDV